MRGGWWGLEGNRVLDQSPVRQGWNPGPVPSKTGLKRKNTDTSLCTPSSLSVLPHRDLDGICTVPARPWLVSTLLVVDTSALLRFCVVETPSYFHFPLLLFCLYDEPFFSQETLIFGTTNVIQSSIIWLCPQKTCTEVSHMRSDVCCGPHISAVHLHSALLVSHRELTLPSHPAHSLYFPQNATRDCPTPWSVCFPDACCATFEIKESVVPPLFIYCFVLLLSFFFFYFVFGFGFLVQGIEPKSLNMLGKSLLLSSISRGKNLSRACMKWEGFQSRNINK